MQTDPRQRLEAPPTATPAERAAALFEGLRASDDADRVPRARLIGALEAAGLRGDDPRLADLRAGLADEADEHLDAAALDRVVRPALDLVERACRGRLVVPAFAAFAGQLEEIFEGNRWSDGGEVADYIPQLGRVDPALYAMSVCTIDGQRASFGDAGHPFCVQSTCKPTLYSLALEEHGEEVVHRHVGREPSGQSFNELTLNRDGLPHNPMINAGAIMCCALIGQGLPAADRFDRVVDLWRRLAGGRRPGFSNATYLSERRTADRNFALGYFMREKGAFPPDTDLVETLEFYFQCCSIESDAAGMAVLAGTLASGGVCPTTGERVLRPDTVRKCLSLMSSCGMYDFSGEWAFRIGLPAKSGVSGAILVVVPGLMGACIWSPRLDRLGNSVRGVRVASDMVERYAFHAFDGLGHDGKADPRLPPDRDGPAPDSVDRA